MDKFLILYTLWRHHMETFSALLAISAGNSPSPVNFPHKGQWRGALMFSLICAWINRWVNNREAGDLRRHRAHYDVIVMIHIYIQGKNTVSPFNLLQGQFLLRPNFNINDWGYRTQNSTRVLECQKVAALWRCISPIKNVRRALPKC